MPNYRIHRLRENVRQQFRNAAHVSGAAVVKLRTQRQRLVLQLGDAAAEALIAGEIDLGDVEDAAVLAGLELVEQRVLHLELAKAGKRHVFALYRSFDDDGEEGVDKFAGVSLGDAVLVGQPGREIDIGHVLFLLLGGKG